jgi:TorA maturation chaperone TorD
VSGTTASETRETRCRALLAEAAAFRSLGLVFERPHDGSDGERALLGEELDDEAMREALAAARNVSEGTYLAVFGPAGAVSPREAGWRRRADPAEILADVAAFYEAFAYTPRAEEPADHIAIEVGFVAYLRLKEAFAITNEDDPAARLTAEASARFLDLHLRRWAGCLAGRLVELGVVEFAPTAQALCARLGACATAAEAFTAGLSGARAVADPFLGDAGGRDGLWSCGGAGAETACPYSRAERTSRT